MISLLTSAVRRQRLERRNLASKLNARRPINSMEPSTADDGNASSQAGKRAQYEKYISGQVPEPIPSCLGQERTRMSSARTKE